MNLATLSLKDLTDIINSPRAYDIATGDLIMNIKSREAYDKKFITHAFNYAGASGLPDLLMGMAIGGDLNNVKNKYYYGFVEVSITVEGVAALVQAELVGLAGDQASPTETVRLTVDRNFAVAGRETVMIYTAMASPKLFQQIYYGINMAAGTVNVSYNFHGIEIGWR